ncbi:hypothetical protein N7478_009940 [Penicillium angulare]|uniref:uncharacterized protein n=1 Tax=Penicillium angulare TaxID=116970 RepID=UPI0025419FF3|nr:uncharacterized protein N7478_009940 [Penicillium angulare]KAJ5267132.1 hypothetical protein N7478_009940 [Penicillium angulare]
MGEGANSSSNHPTTSISGGGTSSQPTPANNVGGGSGLGDQGFTKGGSNDSSNVKVERASGHDPANASNSFAGLQDQKERAGNKTLQRFPGSADDNGSAYSGEDRNSFMAQKPGGSDTLPGWDKAKDILNLNP